MQPMHQIADVQNFLKEMESKFRAPPNQDENWWELRKNAERSFRETGNAIFWLVQNHVIGAPTEIYLIMTAKATKSVATSSRPEQWLVQNWKGENIVIPAEDIREFRTMLTYGIKPPEPETKTIFIELPADATCDERDALVTMLSSREIPGIAFAILPPGVRAVSPSRYGVREELGGYSYSVWGETATEVMAMQAKITGREPTKSDSTSTFIDPAFYHGHSALTIGPQGSTSGRAWTEAEIAAMQPEWQRSASAQTEANWKSCWSGILASKGITPDGKPLTPENLAATRKIMDEHALSNETDFSANRDELPPLESQTPISLATKHLNPGGLDGCLERLEKAMENQHKAIAAAAIQSSPDEWLEESSDQKTWTRVPDNSRAVLRYVRKCGQTDRSSWEGIADDTQPTSPEATPIKFKEFL